MKKIISFIFAIIVTNAFVFGNEELIGADKKAITEVAYVSSSMGDDANDGSKEKPLKTFAKIPRKNARIYLKRGDTFYEPLATLENCIVSAYGKGKKPVINGLKILKNKNAWVDMKDGTWRLDLNKTEDFEGRNPKIENTRALNMVNNVGTVYDINSDTLYGHKVSKPEDMKAQWDFFNGDTWEYAKLTPESFRYLYLKLDKNPASTDAKFAISTYGCGVSELKNVEIQNVAIVGFGRHGLVGCRNVYAKNLDIDIIGGSTQVGYRKWVRLGNGIEFWIVQGEKCQNNNLVEYCTISRTYDCGSTIQGSVKSGSIVAKNITFRKNKFYRCRQGFEHFLSVENKEGAHYSYENCIFENNLLWDMGNNEFSTPEPRDLNFLNYDRRRGNMIIRNNICYGSGIYAGGLAWSKCVSNNTFYVPRGKQPLVFVYKYDGKDHSIQANTAEDIDLYREKVGDTTSKIIYYDPKDTTIRDELLSGRFKWVKSFGKEK